MAEYYEEDNSQLDIDVSQFDETFAVETISGMNVDETTGELSQGEMFDAEKYMTDFAKFEDLSLCFVNMARSKVMKVIEKDGQLTADSGEKASKFDADGTIAPRRFTCPYCGKKVDMLLKNGYCSKECATKARLEKARTKVSGAMEKTLDVLEKVKNVLGMLDGAVNILSQLPEFIRMKARLPEYYREYVTLRIDKIFLMMKRAVNNLMIKKNEYMILILNKVKSGSLDKVLESAFAPIRVIVTTITSVQTALNTVLSSIIALLQLPTNGPIPPESMGWFRTAKSSQHPAHMTEFCIPVVPDINKVLPKWSGNMINYQAIDAMVNSVMPPI